MVGLDSNIIIITNTSTVEILDSLKSGDLILKRNVKQLAKLYTESRLIILYHRLKI